MLLEPSRDDRKNEIARRGKIKVSRDLSFDWAALGVQRMPSSKKNVKTKSSSSAPAQTPSKKPAAKTAAATKSAPSKSATKVSAISSSKTQATKKSAAPAAKPPAAAKTPEKSKVAPKAATPAPAAPAKTANKTTAAAKAPSPTSKAAPTAVKAPASKAASADKSPHITKASVSKAKAPALEKTASALTSKASAPTAKTPAKPVKDTENAVKSTIKVAKPVDQKSTVPASGNKSEASAKAAPIVTKSTAPSQAKAPQVKTPVEASAAAKTAPASPAPPRPEMTKPSAPKPAAPIAPATASAPAPKQAGIDPKAAQPAKAKIAGPKHGFKLNEFIVYPAHGVGQITGVEIQEVAGFSLELFVVSFLKDKMILKVPTSKVITVGMRKLAETNIVEKALSTLSGRARIKRTMWSRRAQEYEAKINSGDLVTIAEVVRDLYRSETQPEQSYSERQLYEAALDRMAREIAAVRRLIDAEALKLIESFLQKGPKRSPKIETEGEGDDAAASDADTDADGDDSDVDRAA